MDKKLLKEIKNSKEIKNLKIYGNITEIYWPKSLKEYKILLNSISDSSIQYHNNLLKEKSSILIETNNLDSILSLDSKTITVEVGTPLVKIDRVLKQNNNTIHPFDKSELLQEVSFIEDNQLKKVDSRDIDIEELYQQKNIYSLKYKIYSIKESKRAFYQYKHVLALLNDIMKIKEYKRVSIYNNFATLLLKYDTPLLLSRKLWKDFRENFYYKTSLKRRRKNILILKSLLKKYQYYSLAFNSREKKDDEYIPENFQIEFSKDKDEYLYFLSFLKNEFDRVEFLNQKIDLSVKIENIYSFIKFTESSDDIFFYEISIFKSRAKITGLFVSLNKKNYLKNNLFLEQLK